MHLKKQLLIAGGDEDPNLKTLLAAARRFEQPVYPLLVGRNSNPSLIWEMNSDELLIDGRRLGCSAAFLRYDIFTALKGGKPSSSYRALSWYTTLSGWLSAHSKIRMFNRRNLRYVTNKPYVLHLARNCGLKIPDTVITNDFSYLKQFEKNRRVVVKPVGGGGYCQSFDEVREQTELKNEIAAAPAIAQNRLVAPEVRVYAVGKNFFAFQITSEALDYRTTRECEIEYLEGFTDDVTAGLRKLLDALGLDFAAADFKTCPKTDELIFLEVNTSPMFTAFDAASKGSLAGAMIKFLISKTNAG